MAKYKILIISILCCSLTALAGVPELHTLRVRKVGPGVTQKVLEAPEKPWVIHVLEVDISGPYIDVQAVDGGGLEKPSVMAAAEETENRRLVGTVNGDFYDAAAQSTNAGIVDGRIVKLESFSSDSRVYWPALSINTENKLNISCNRFEGNAFCLGCFGGHRRCQYGQGQRENDILQPLLWQFDGHLCGRYGDPRPARQ
ncbi:MAG: hypothetical protein U5N26_06550 [Candidatus Marinimicrobia bacterium]|nr:hypothetical protein [Candidatus Neomarinimicrobiota bacterium]